MRYLAAILILVLCLAPAQASWDSILLGRFVLIPMKGDVKPIKGTIVGTTLNEAQRDLVVLVEHDDGAYSWHRIVDIKADRKREETERQKWFQPIPGKPPLQIPH